MTATDHTSPVILYPRSDDLLSHAARHIIARSGSLPDLTGFTVLLPDLLFARELRRQLLECASSRGCRALLGPVISTPEQWLAEQVPTRHQVPGRARRELLLVEAIIEHRSVFGPNTEPWGLAANLLALFDELTLHRVPVDDTPEAFRERLQSAYGLAGTPPEPFDHEARIVQRLWQAWHQQLAASDLLDPAAAQLQQLVTLREHPPASFLFFVGTTAPHAAMADWMKTLLERDQGQLLLTLPLPGMDLPPHMATLVDHAREAEAESMTTGASHMLDLALGSHATPLQTRAQQAHRMHPAAPPWRNLRSFTANSPEQEAHAMELQVRRWLLAGISPVAVVTEDRRLGRRVRALLERAGITMQDPGGWALSTTRAAAAVERWLQTVEEDFAHEPLLDTLKSPFTLPDEDRDRLEHSVFRFETDIVRREQVASGLQRYRRQIDARQARHRNPWSNATATHLHSVLQRLEEAAAPLRECLKGTCAANELLLRLRQSLEAIGIWQAFTEDPAGQRIQHEWRLLHDAATGTPLPMDWPAFRAWLGSALEQHDFRPAPSNSPVWLLNLQQAQLGRFGGVVIGACDSAHLPAVPARAAFFNERVRSELQLPTWPQQHTRQLEQFCNLLEAAPNVLLTWHREQNGEQRTPAAWLARLEVFHRLAWQQDMEDTELALLVDRPGTRVDGRHPMPLPATTIQPRARLPETSLPYEISVTAHGTLIDCPYLFFAGSGLRLRAREEVRRELEKAEFGSLVHRILDIFHGGAEGYPPPLQQPLDVTQRDTAIKRLEAVSRTLFTQELENSFEHRAWLRRWLAMIGPYVDWLIRHQANDWRFEAGERKGEIPLTGGRTLAGRIDRVDRSTAGTLIIDYKTGRAPDQEAVDSGEAIQLHSYALLEAQMPRAVEYVLIDKNNSRPVRTGSRLEGAQLAELSEAVRARLETVLSEITAGTGLPAWGDARTCEHCEMDGLCRRDAWPDS